MLKLRGQRGLTLIEVLVAATLMLALLGVVIGIHLSGQQAHVKAEAKEDSKSQVLVASEKLKNELRHATVDSAAVGVLTYRVPHFDPSGLPRTDASGNIDFLTDPVRVEMVGGALQRVHLGQTTILGHLGPQGTAVFTLSGRNLTIALSARHGQDRPDRQADARLVVELFLPNQI